MADSLFCLGAERGGAGLTGEVDRAATAEPGLVVRRVDAEAVPPLSDYAPFWRRRVPFLFLTGGRWRHYHTPEDTPDATGRLPESSRGRLQMLLLGLEQGLA